MKTHLFDYTCWEALPGAGCFDSPNGKKLPTLEKKGGVKRIIGRKILEACQYLGSYGMGGPGFFGFLLEKKGRYPQEWIVLRTWGANSWLLLDGKWLDCHPDYWAIDKCYFSEYISMFSDSHKRIQDTFVGLTVSDFKIHNRAFLMILQDDKRIHKLEWPSDLTKLPPYGIGSVRKWVNKKEKMKDGFIISFTSNINI